MQFLDNLKPLGLLLLRVALGASFVLHGYPKLLDPQHAAKEFSAYGFPGYSTYVIGLLEVFGGGLLIAGLLTRVVALLLTIETGLILYRTIVPADGIKGFGHFETPLFVTAMAFLLVTTGPGVISVDAFTFESGKKPARKAKAKK
jgi:putative oxidoreductase